MQVSIVELFNRYKDLILLEAEMKSELENIQFEISEILDAIQELETAGLSTMKDGMFTSGYRDSWKVIQKAIYVIRSYGKCLSVRDIVDRIKVLESKEDDIDFDRQLMSSMSSALSTNAKKGKRISRYQQYEGDDWLYGLIEWFDDNNHPKDEYKIF